MKKGLDYYIEQKEKNEKLVLALKKDISKVSYLRLADFVLGLGTSIYTYTLGQYAIFGAVTLLWIGLFIYLIKLHEVLLDKKSFAEALISINSRGIDRIKGTWNTFKDDGKEFTETEHPYCTDLDITGHSSLFQWTNTSFTYMGRLRLRDYLLNPLKDKLLIKKRQEAVRELSGEIEWRQQLNAEGMLISEKSRDPKELLQWVSTPVEKGSIVSLIVTNILTLTILTAIFLVAFTRLLSYKYLLLAAAVNFLVLALGSRKRNENLDTVHKYKDGIRVYERMIKSIEDKEFKSEAAEELKRRFETENKVKASVVIRELKAVADLLADRANMAYIIIDIMFLWDYRTERMLKKWKSNYGRYFEGWLEALGEVEALCSLSNIAFENEKWCFPEIGAGGPVLQAENLGHPLLGDKRVCNDITIKEKGSVVLITGSNMSGKSTFLRTVGINLILSYCGAPVCASGFKCSLMEVYTCMRVSDNLEKSISSFYAEILRIKMIVNASRENINIFFLLDEIFKGTNSIDRHQGAKVLIKQLSRCGASGLVSTHDLELGEMEKESPRIFNYNFQEYYEAGELRFDYRLRKGISQTRNAMHIIRLAGIDIE
ncbi:MAG: DNA repair protein [Bacillota bacterium]|nr:DNA repair protein [Bacillota bacterium]